MIEIKTDMIHTQAWTCLALIQVGTVAVFLWPKFREGPPLLRVELFKQRGSSMRDQGQFQISVNW